jgi:hypothetical protein
MRLAGKKKVKMRIQNESSRAERVAEEYSA